MTLDFVVTILQVLFLLYFVGLNAGYLTLNLVSIVNITGYMRRQDLDRLPSMYLGLEPPISILAPAYNEAATIVASVRSLLQQTYGDYEIVVINDGSSDRTLEVLIAEFDLVPFPEAMRVRLATQPLRAIYHSPLYPNLRVVDKENGGKSDALNAGLNAARYPLVCAVDADSVLQRNSLERVVQPFLEDPNTVASGGCIRVANGCTIQDGFLTEVGLPSNPLALIQIAEYLRAFLFGRLGWSPMNALLIISGAFGVFNKERVIEAGGYLPTTVGEDMELVVRLHRTMTEAGVPYRIVFVPDPICWTEVPESLRVLGTQRVRWQRGLLEALWINRKLLFHPKGKAVGWLAFPFMLLFEAVGPLVEVAGYLFMVLCFLLDLISPEAMIIFSFLSIGLGVLLSLTALVLEEISFHLYGQPKHIMALFAASVLENFGFRQINSLWRAMGVFGFIFQRKGQWGRMERKADWATNSKKTSPGGKAQAGGPQAAANAALLARARAATEGSTPAPFTPYTGGAFPTPDMSAHAAAPTGPLPALGEEPPTPHTGAMGGAEAQTGAMAAPAWTKGSAPSTGPLPASPTGFLSTAPFPQAAPAGDPFAYGAVDEFMSYSQVWTPQGPQGTGPLTFPQAPAETSELQVEPEEAAEEAAWWAQQQAGEAALPPHHPA